MKSLRLEYNFIKLFNIICIGILIALLLLSLALIISGIKNGANYQWINNITYFVMGIGTLSLTIINTYDLLLFRSRDKPIIKVDCDGDPRIISVDYNDDDVIYVKSYSEEELRVAYIVYIYIRNIGLRDVAIDKIQLSVPVVMSKDIKPNTRPVICEMTPSSNLEISNCNLKTDAFSYWFDNRSFDEVGQCTEVIKSGHGKHYKLMFIHEIQPVRQRKINGVDIMNISNAGPYVYTINSSMGLETTIRVYDPINDKPAECKILIHNLEFYTKGEFDSVINNQDIEKKNQDVINGRLKPIILKAKTIL